MKTASETRQILDKLEGQHPDADTELHHTNAFELLVATILSAQSTDERVNLVTPALFKRYPDAKALAKATTAQLEPRIHSTGFFRAKSKALVGMAQALVTDHGGQVPADMQALTKLPGVGRKTANVVLGHALGVPGLPVDRHVSPRGQPDRHRRIGQARDRRAATVRRAAARAVDADVRYAHPPWPPHLQAEAALRPMRRAGGLRVLPDRHRRRAHEALAEQAADQE